jgi:hypothetical protein
MFIQIDEKYAIESDKNGWAISKFSKDKNKGDGFRQFKWYSSFESALLGLARMQIRLLDTNTLDDAIKGVEEVMRHLAKALTVNEEDLKDAINLFKANSNYSSSKV